MTDFREGDLFAPLPPHPPATRNKPVLNSVENLLTFTLETVILALKLTQICCIKIYEHFFS